MMLEDCCGEYGWDIAHGEGLCRSVCRSGSVPKAARRSCRQKIALCPAGKFRELLPGQETYSSIVVDPPGSA